MATAKKSATAVKKAVSKAPAKKAAPAKANAKKAPAPAKKAAVAPKPVAKKAPAAKAAPAAPEKKATPAKAPARAKKVVLDKWQQKQKDLLLSEKAEYLEQARLLQDEADELMRGAEPGDVQFDDESGEGGTLAIDRERDIALALQALSITEEIDDALRKLDRGQYGTCETCGQNIMKARLEALPYARQCIACKTGGLSRR
jgi:DnaK suppressor protein